ncbi:MAG TPA: YraN family protein [Solirubrobacteraceae bacterium]
MSVYAPTNDPAPGDSGRSSGDPRRALGRAGEELAAAHMRRRGFDVIARNVRTRFGEIDLIARDGEVLAFIEVKTRRGRAGGLSPLEGLHARQRTRLRRLAAAWLAATAPRAGARTIRFDAIGVTIDARGRLVRLEHLEGAW